MLDQALPALESFDKFELPGVVVDGTSVAGTALVVDGKKSIEFEPGLQADLAELLDRLVPPSRDYGHERAWHDGNGHSHLRSSLVGPSLTLPFNKKKLVLGTWQQIIFIDFDNRARERRLILQFLGE